MSQSDLSAMSDEELRRVFKRLAIAMSWCELTKKFNRLAHELHGVRNVIKSRGPNAVRKFLPLLSHSNPRVRLSAATLCYDLASEDCLRVIRDIEKRSRGSVAVHAMMFLYDHDEEWRQAFSAEMKRRYGPFFQNWGDTDG